MGVFRTSLEQRHVRLVTFGDKSAIIRPERSSADKRNANPITPVLLLSPAHGFALKLFPFSRVIVARRRRFPPFPDTFLAHRVFFFLRFQGLTRLSPEECAADH